MKLYSHPFSSYCQKVLIALYEKNLPFEVRLLGSDEAIAAEHAALWPLKRMPVLVDDGCTYVEASIIIEYLDLVRPGTLAPRASGTEGPLVPAMHVPRSTFASWIGSSTTT